MNRFLAVMSMLKPAFEAADMMEKVGDACLDAIEELVTRTDNTIDDIVILPAIKGLRHVAGIADEQKQEDPNNEA